MLSYAEVFYEGARSQLLPTRIVLRAVWCYLPQRADGGGTRREGGDGKGPRFFQCRMVLSSADQTESSPTGCSVNGNLVRKKYLIHPDRICLLH